MLRKSGPHKGHRFALEAFAREARADEVQVLVQRTRRGTGLERLPRELGIFSKVRWLLTRSPCVTCLST